MSSPLLVETFEGWARLRLHRPEARNALNRELVDALLVALEDLGRQEDLRVVILDTSDPRAFCAGADLRERATMKPPEVEAFLSSLRRLMDRVSSMPMPTLAVVRGFALGGGLELALACDLRIAADEASLGLTEVRLGIIPGAGGTQRLSRVAGQAVAKAMIFTGRRVNGTEAASLGIVHESAPQDALDVRVAAWRDELLAAAPLALRQAKRAIDGAAHLSLPHGLDWEQSCYRPLLKTEDRLEALQAFAEKRPPRFVGK